ncbi:ROK family protein [Streptomyces turgidiscabies]|uniref:ROK family protein n=1 Tax=Streptomyces turgidiscabies TaxID=85558 RepID=UPI00389A9232
MPLGQGSGEAGVLPGRGPGGAGVQSGQGLGGAGASLGQGLGEAGASLGPGPGEVGVPLGQGSGEAGALPGRGPGGAGVQPGQGLGGAGASLGPGPGEVGVPLGQGSGEAGALPGQGPGGAGVALAELAERGRGAGGFGGSRRGGVGILGVGVALPGPLDHAGGVLHRVTGFPEWDGFPLRDALARRLGVPVAVDKDTNAAAFGLALGGEGGSFAYLHLGTGLGAGLVLGGTLHRGTRTGAGEFGHQVVQLDGPPCGCGDRGCIEALCLAAVARGDLDEAARVLGVGAANLVGLLDIDRVLLGGRTIAADPERFVRGVATVLAERARREGADQPVPVRVAPGGARAVAEGAAQLLLAPLFGRAEG